MYPGNSKNLIALFLLVLMLFLASVPGKANASEKKADAAKVSETGETYALEIEFTGKKPDTRIAKVDSREMMIAFRMKAETDDFILGDGKQKFKGIRYERLPGGAGAIFLTTRDHIEAYESSWSQDGKNLKISVRTLKKEQIKAPAEQVHEPTGPAQKPEDVEFMNSLRTMPCFSGGDLSSSFAAVSEENFESASGIIEEYLSDIKNEGRCADAAMFLKAYIFYRTKGKDDPGTARRMFQEAMVRFPDSAYLPYSALYLGELELSLSGYAPAAGYFNYILTNYPDFKAKPQAIFGQAISNINLDNLVSAFRGLSDLYANYPDSPYTEQAAFQQGKIYFKRGDYAEALSRFEAYVAKNKDKVYESPDLLYYLGSSAYHTGDNKKAIDYLSRAYNFFPEINEPDILFSRIAESYVEEGQLEKARKIYELVREKYSGTDGFAVSSVRLAGFAEKPEEKEALYQEVIDGFPGNPLAGLSMLKLAQSRYDAGDYEKSIMLLENLLSGKPGSVKKEGDELMVKSIEKFFASKTGDGDFLDAVKTYETRKKLMDNYATPRIQYLIGKSYLGMGLYEPAQEHFSLADKGFGRNRPPGFAYDYALSLDETGRIAEAKHMLVEASSGDSKSSVDALRRLARIQMAEGKQDEALNTYREAFSRSETPGDKASILLDQTDIFEKDQDIAGLIAILDKADDLITSGKNPADNEVLLKVLKKLGEAKVKSGDFEGASSDFKRALAVKKQGEADDELSFLLADAYERMKKRGEASEIFKKISESENDFWAKLAKERFEQLSFYEKLGDSEKNVATQ